MPNPLDLPESPKKGFFNKASDAVKGLPSDKITKVAKIGGPLLAAGLLAKDVYDFATDDTAHARAATETNGDVGKIKGQDIGEMAGNVAGAALPFFIPLIGPIVGAVLSPFTSAFGGWIGKMAGGWIGSENETEKNTRELKKNTDTLRATADSSTVTNLNDLQSNVMKTARAYSSAALPKNEITSVLPVKIPTSLPSVIPLTSASPVPQSSGTGFMPPLTESGTFIAAPAAFTRKAVSNDVNKTYEEIAAPINIKAPPALASLTPNITSSNDPNFYLQQMLAGIQESNELLTRQLELQERLNRLSTMSQIPSKEIRFNRTIKNS